LTDYIYHQPGSPRHAALSRALAQRLAAINARWERFKTGDYNAPRIAEPPKPNDQPR
jgi:hypothetical protein